MIFCESFPRRSQRWRELARRSRSISGTSTMTQRKLENTSVMLSGRSTCSRIPINRFFKRKLLSSEMVYWHVLGFVIILRLHPKAHTFLRLQAKSSHFFSQHFECLMETLKVLFSFFRLQHKNGWSPSKQLW